MNANENGLTAGSNPAPATNFSRKQRFSQTIPAQETLEFACLCRASLVLTTSKGALFWYNGNILYAKTMLKVLARQPMDALVLSGGPALSTGHERGWPKQPNRL